MEAGKNISELVDRTLEYGLGGVEIFAQFPAGRIAKEYNGIGPEWLPSEERDKITSYLSIFEPAALIHDLRFAKSDGKRFAFNFANMEFHANCIKCAKATYGLLNWRRYRACFVADLLYQAVKCDWCWKRWLECAPKISCT